jgi:hypothetical protein
VLAEQSNKQKAIMPVNPASYLLPRTLGTGHRCFLRWPAQSRQSHSPSSCAIQVTVCCVRVFHHPRAHSAAHGAGGASEVSNMLAARRPARVRAFRAARTFRARQRQIISDRAPQRCRQPGRLSHASSTTLRDGARARAPPLWPATCPY